MTPEQERNYWILEGYPLMPEWIEFCRGYWVLRAPLNHGAVNTVGLNKLLDRWAAAITVGYGTSARCSFAQSMNGGYLAYQVNNDYYDWNLGESNAFIEELRP